VRRGLSGFCECQSRLECVFMEYRLFLYSTARGDSGMTISVKMPEIEEFLSPGRRDRGFLQSEIIPDASWQHRAVQVRAQELHGYTVSTYRGAEREHYSQGQLLDRIVGQGLTSRV
jgi:hypothetical protein